jgi:hypothetical protein
VFSVSELTHITSKRGPSEAATGMVKRQSSDATSITSDGSVSNFDGDDDDGDGKENGSDAGRKHGKDAGNRDSGDQDEGANAVASTTARLQSSFHKVLNFMTTTVMCSSSTKSDAYVMR